MTPATATWPSPLEQVCGTGRRERSRPDGDLPAVVLTPRLARPALASQPAGDGNVNAAPTRLPLAGRTAPGPPAVAVPAVPARLLGPAAGPSGRAAHPLTPEQS